MSIFATKVKVDAPPQTIQQLYAGQKQAVATTAKEPSRLQRAVEYTKVQVNRARWGTAFVVAGFTGGYGGLLASIATPRNAGFGTKLFMCGLGAAATAVWAATGHDGGLANLLAGQGAGMGPTHIGGSSGSFMHPAFWMSGSVVTAPIGSVVANAIAPENSLLNRLNSKKKSS